MLLPALPWKGREGKEREGRNKKHRIDTPTGHPRHNKPKANEESPGTERREKGRLGEGDEGRS